MWILSIIAFLVLFSILVLVHEWGHYRAALWAGVRPEEFAIGFGREILSWQKGETRFRLNLIPLGGYVKMTGEAEGSNDPRAFDAAPVWKRIVITIAGVIMNWLLAIVVLGGLYFVGVEPVILTQNDFDTAVEQGIVELEKEGEAVVGYSINEVQLPFGEAALRGVTDTARVSKMVVQKVAEIPATMIQTGTLPADLSGPVGIAQITHEVTPQGIKPLLKLLAVLSISLAVMNLLPIPALDGGMLVFLAYELVTRRRPSPTAQGILTYAGIFLLLLFFVSVTWQDVTRLISPISA